MGHTKKNIADYFFHKKKHFKGLVGVQKQAASVNIHIIRLNHQIILDFLTDEANADHKKSFAQSLKNFENHSGI